MSSMDDTDGITEYKWIYNPLQTPQRPSGSPRQCKMHLWIFLVPFQTKISDRFRNSSWFRTHPHIWWKPTQQKKDHNGGNSYNSFVWRQGIPQKSWKKIELYIAILDYTSMQSLRWVFHSQFGKVWGILRFETRPYSHGKWFADRKLWARTRRPAREMVHWNHRTNPGKNSVKTSLQPLLPWKNHRTGPRSYSEISKKT